MKKLAALAFCISIGCILVGCNKSVNSGPATSETQSPEAAIRTAIQAHLAHQGTLNLQSFDTDVKTVTIQGDHAQAQVEFRVKNGPGAMSMTYQLQQTNGAWSVLDANPQGSDFSHPPLTGTPPQVPGGPGAPTGAAHSLGDTIRSFTGGAPAQTQLPPGHPAAAPNGQ